MDTYRKLGMLPNKPAAKPVATAPAPAPVKPAPTLPVAPVASVATPVPTIAPRLTDDQVSSLCNSVFGTGFALSLSTNTTAEELRSRLVRSLYFAHAAVPPLTKEFESLARKFPLAEPRGRDRMTRARRQTMVNEWLQANDFLIDE